ncbi:acetate/propionate family kinase [Rubrobacter tropicus]|uniref:Acetate kinase n=1 Tax=Rubrobacter tropicus TaxID=2653851 RepID=A0A6G8QDF7_9ACTN|nr:acetate/propionate family kinase [Rubrobacter tropicus]QIN84468.1 acetate/propionate family kinase [Rubrobacter tropicus]
MRVLTINCGSSTLKFGLFESEGERFLVRGAVDRIGGSGGNVEIYSERGEKTVRPASAGDHIWAALLVMRQLDRCGLLDGVGAVGHRIVHGGARFSGPALLDPAALKGIEALGKLAPLHNRPALAAIRAVREALGPEIPQVAAFDTAFHRTMPHVARLFALPRRFADEGVVRYGFHGLSYEYVVGELRRLDPEAAAGRVVIAHLGNGASMAAVREGVGVDTTMGFTPSGGLVMGTRPGDLDPGVILHLLRSMDPGALRELVNRESGLLGVSGTSADMRDLLERVAEDPRAAEAVALFCYAAKKSLGSLAAALGGLDTLVFTGGIGEHASAVRWRICEGLEFLGIRLDPERNAQNAPVVSRDGEPVAVHVIPADEDLTIARHTYKLARFTSQEGA